MYKEAYFSEKKFTNGQNMGLPLWVWVKKTVDEVEQRQLSNKEKVPGAADNKAGHVDSVLEHERTNQNWFFWKGGHYKKCFLLPTPKAKFTLFMKKPLP